MTFKVCIKPIEDPVRALLGGLEFGGGSPQRTLDEANPMPECPKAFFCNAGFVGSDIDSADSSWAVKIRFCQEGTSPGSDAPGQTAGRCTWPQITIASSRHGMFEKKPCV